MKVRRREDTPRWHDSMATESHSSFGNLRSASEV